MKKILNEETKSSESETQWMSLAQAMDCLINDLEPGPTGNQPVKNHSFPDSHELFENFLAVLSSGEISSRGKLSLVEIKRRAFDRDNSNEARDENEYIEPIRMNLRRDESFITGMGSEHGFSPVTSEYWWNSLPIWERSTLWLIDLDLHPDNRVSKLKVEKYDPFHVERPYELEQILCFTEVQVSVSSFNLWTESKSSNDVCTKVVNNPRRAGAKPTEDWDAWENWLEEQLNNKKQWRDWNAVWSEAYLSINGINDESTKHEKHQKLVGHLRRNNTDLLSRIKKNIERSPEFVKISNAK